MEARAHLEVSSLVKGTEQDPLWNRTLGHILDEQAKRFEAHTAVSMPWQNASLTYRDLATQSKSVANAMLSYGLQHGDRIAIMAGNCYQYIETFTAAARIGCPFVVLNSTYSLEELINALSVTSCRMLFLAENIGPKSLSRHLVGLQQQRANLPGLQSIVTLGETSRAGGASSLDLTYEEFYLRGSEVSTSALQEASSLVRPDDLLNLQFTSGTTGQPKAAMLTHNNLINNGRFVGAAMRLTSSDVIACPPPLFHCFGLVMGFLASLVHGSSITFPSDQFNADAVLDTIYESGCTALLGVPTMFMAILEAKKQKGLGITTLRTGLAAGSSVPAPLMRQLATELGITGMLIAYGMTETSPVTFVTSLDDSEKYSTSTVGRVMPHTAAKVIDQQGNILPIGVAGELCTSGYALQKGYWNNPAKTREVMKQDENGVVWMHTGDECVIDREGYCRVTGRIKDIIIRGGENIFPAEIEERILQHPQVAEASVVAIKDHKYGEVVGAFLKRKEKLHSGVQESHTDRWRAGEPLSTEIAQWTRKTLGSHKSPVYVFWVGGGRSGTVGHASVLDDFPKTGSGKYQKHIMRDIGNGLVQKQVYPAIERKYSKL